MGTPGEANQQIPDGVSRDTLKQHFRALVERGHLNQHGNGRGVWYELR
jgi:predicted HTH transcriptional regulator